MTRIACGPSHYICWTTQDNQTSNDHEPVLFADSKIHLGTYLVGNKGFNNDNSSRQKALAHVLNALQIMYVREAIVAAIAPHNDITTPTQVTSNPGIR